MHSAVDNVNGLLFVCIVPSENGKLPFPGMSELNARLRRIVAAFQKSHKRELLKQEQNEKVCVVSGLYSHSVHKCCRDYFGCNYDQTFICKFLYKNRA